jgi:SAM-dependent methyltransferase
VLLEVAKRLAGTGHLHGFDVADGVLAVARSKLEIEGLDAKLERRDASSMTDIETNRFDRVMANYMIHYVENIPMLLREVRRVLRPDGVFVLATESIESMPEMYDVHFAALESIGAPASLFRASPKARFSMESGRSLLEQTFETVNKSYYLDVLEFDSPEPYLEFYTVGHNYCCAKSAEGDALPGDNLAQLLREVRARVEREIDQHGAFRVSKKTGAFVCSGSTSAS